MDKNILIGLTVLSLVSLLLVSLTKDTFIDSLLNDNYSKRGCTRENRYYPTGKIPGSYLGLTEAERQGLLKDFINNNAYLKK